MGAVLRVVVRAIAVRRIHDSWRATLAVNLAGSAAIGVIAAHAPSAPAVHALLVPGVLGGFTTFSGFALESMTAIGSGRWARLVTILLGTLIGCPLLTLAVMHWSRG